VVCVCVVCVCMCVCGVCVCGVCVCVVYVCACECVCEYLRRALGPIRAVAPQREIV